jgi:hypothetical protein
VHSFLINYAISSTVMLAVGGSGSCGIDKLVKETFLFAILKPYIGADLPPFVAWSNRTSQKLLSLMG